MMRLLYSIALVFALNNLVAQNQMFLTGGGLSGARWANHPSALLVLDSALDTYEDASCSNPTEANDVVRCWKDQTSGKQFTTSGFGPSIRTGGLNSELYVRSRVSNNVLHWADSLLTFSSDSTYTIALVISWQGAVSSYTWDYFLDGWPNRGNITFETNGSDAYTVFGTSYTPFTDTSYRFVSSVAKPSEDSYLYDNRNLVLTYNSSTTWDMLVGNDGTTPGSTTPGVTIMGYNPSNTFANSNVDLYYFAIFSPGLTPSEIDDLNDYLANRY